MSELLSDLIAYVEAVVAGKKEADPKVGTALNDLLQYLGFFTFRAPVPGYRHDAAIVMALRGWIESDAVPAGAPLRPESDRAVLAEIVERMERWA